MNKTIFVAGVALGLFGVILGAFGAHGLENMIDAPAIKSFETGVSYQMYHAFFLLILGSVAQIPECSKHLIYYMVVVGVVLFSGSIYLLATNDLTSFDFRKIALLTPLGGTILIFAWALLGYRSLKQFVL